MIIASLALSFILIILSTYVLSNILITILLAAFLFIGLYLLLKRTDLDRSDNLKKITKDNEFIVKARDNLLRSVNHELRAPLSRMKIDIEMLKNEEIRKSLNEDIEYMHTLVEELMEIEKIKVEVLDKASLDLTKLINEVIDKLNLDLDVLFFEQEESIFYKGDERKLEKLFKNLLENAYKYKDEEGCVRVKIQEAKKKIIVTVMNEGTSVPTEDLPFLFEPFYRVDKAREVAKGGLGLGLNICKEIVSAHDGKIQVSSKKGLGTIFKISLQR